MTADNLDSENVMNYKQLGFRAIDHAFIVVPLNDSVRKAVSSFPDADTANCVLCYGYIDHECGVSLEVLALGVNENGGYQFYSGNDSEVAIIRIGAVCDLDLTLISDDGGSLAIAFADKIELVSEYDAPDDVMET